MKPNGFPNKSPFGLRLRSGLTLSKARSAAPKPAIKQLAFPQAVMNENKVFVNNPG